MARRNENLYDEVERFIGRITDQQVMTWDDLFTVAVKFCEKDYAYHIQTARRLGETPGVLLLTAMLYVQHPLICAERGVMYNFTRCQAELLKAQLLELDLPVPVRKGLSTVFIHSPIESS